MPDPRRAQYILGQINKGLPHKLSDKLMKQEVDTMGEDVAKHLVDHPDYPIEKKKRLKKLIDSGKLRKTSEELDERVAAKIDERNEREVQKAIASGRLQDPKKDPFVRKRLERIAAGNIKKTDAYSKKEIWQARQALKNAKR
jgi:hypothetical protein